MVLSLSSIVAAAIVVGGACDFHSKISLDQKTARAGIAARFTKYLHASVV